jgi:hypothetical protein
MRKLIKAAIMSAENSKESSSAPNDRKDHAEEASRRSAPPPLWKRPAAWLLGVVFVAATGLATDTFSTVLRSWFNPDEIADRVATSPAISVAGFQRDALLGWSTPAPVPADEVHGAPVDPPDDVGHKDWLRRHDAYALAQEDIWFTLTGERSQPVTITQLRPRLLSCGPPVSGAVFYAPPEGENNVKQLAVNLDRRSPVFHEWDGLSPHSATDPYFAAHTISLAEGEQISIKLMAFAGERSCKWHLDADLLVNGEEETLTLTDATGPLAVSGGVQQTQYEDVYVLSYLLPEAKESDPLFTRVDSPTGLCSDDEPIWCLELSWSTEDLGGYVE